MNITHQIQLYTQKMPRGKPFTTSTLIRYGSRAAIDQALSRLASAGKIVRLTRGTYVRPEISKYVGETLPSPFEVAEVIAKKTNEIIQISGAEAARQLGLSTQVPAQPIFLTTGQSRQFKLGGLAVTLKHVSRKKIPFPESKIGIAILALWYLGKKIISPEIIAKIEMKLTPNEFEKFLSSREYMPAWMGKIILEYKNKKETENAGIVSSTTSKRTSSHS